jgi:hypothetical protein
MDTELREHLATLILDDKDLVHRYSKQYPIMLSDEGVKKILALESLDLDALKKELADLKEKFAKLQPNKCETCQYYGTGIGHCEDCNSIQPSKWVELDEKQSLPTMRQNWYYEELTPVSIYHIAQQDMKDWRKIKPEYLKE